ncbi:MAG: hypothetical protein ACJ0RU_07705 [Candidatus Rariloculaceae bacterium]
MGSSNKITEEVGKIIGSGALGRSHIYERLLSYLAQCSEKNQKPREVDIAIDVFDKTKEFDSNQDSFVRVYIHNLRRKLDDYYAEMPGENGQRLKIAKGQYRLDMVSPEPHKNYGNAKEIQKIGIGFIAGLIVFSIATYFLFDWNRHLPDAYEQVADSPVWEDMLGEDYPLLVVVGDYYIFGELDEFGRVRRLLREFDVNSSDDLDDLFFGQPDLQENYMDLDLTYLPQGAAFALKDLLRVVYTSNKEVRVTTMSELRVADLKSHDILYVGYISALGTLMDFVFASSGLSIGESYDELINDVTGEYYASGAGIPEESNYQDYGLVSTFPGPDGNRFLVIAGTRDSGVMHTAEAITTRTDIEVLERALAFDNEDQDMAFEALYEVTGFDRMNLDAMLIYSSRLQYREIWGGELAAR